MGAGQGRVGFFLSPLCPNGSYALPQGFAPYSILLPKEEVREASSQAIIAEGISPSGFF